MLKIAVFAVLLVATCAYTYEVPAIASQHHNVVRTYGNLGQIATFSKAVDTPFSSVRKSDIRITNPGVAIAPASPVIGPITPLAHPVLPGYSHGHVIAPVGKAIAPGAGLLGVAYSAAPAVSHMTYTNGLGFTYSW